MRTYLALQRLAERIPLLRAFAAMDPNDKVAVIFLLEQAVNR